MHQDRLTVSPVWVSRTASTCAPGPGRGSPYMCVMSSVGAVVSGVRLCCAVGQQVEALVVPEAEDGAAPRHGPTGARRTR